MKRVSPPYLSYLIPLLLIIAFQTKSYASHQRGRLGLGFTNQLITNIPAISFKLQKSPTLALGGLVALSTNETSGGHGAGIKVYRLIFEEPQLNFYGSLLAGLLGQKSGTTSKSGFQFDFNLGSEFHLKGIESIGFSFEFGVSLNKLDNFAIEIRGNHILTAGVHFYL
ncbi:MAG: hypothetical protein CME68_09680 [Halobacteriovoraceae bacterium]|nr:hypothetical protein [Halobacteriovoraceae bacterium]